jgi:glucosamine 6-phosphate synthetase-like amidotransferase/phosphosugar isomerase protein
MTVLKLTHLIMHNIITNYKLLKEWITNRDFKFTSHFWTTLIKKLEIIRKILIVYYS